MRSGYFTIRSEVFFGFFSGETQITISVDALFFLLGAQGRYSLWHSFAKLSHPMIHGTREFLPSYSKFFLFQFTPGETLEPDCSKFLHSFLFFQKEDQVCVCGGGAIGVCVKCPLYAQHFVAARRLLAFLNFSMSGTVATKCFHVSQIEKGWGVS